MPTATKEKRPQLSEAQMLREYVTIVKKRVSLSCNVLRDLISRSSMTTDEAAKFYAEIIKIEKEAGV